MRPGLAHQQPHTTQDILRELVQQRREERPIVRCEADPPPVQLAFSRRDLWHSARISESMFRSLIGSRRSIAKAFVTPGQASFHSTNDHHAEVMVIPAKVPERPPHPATR
ncbi:hypothetical protein [Streptomyces sp. NPDC097610]|uniref:hypothetical protein n=1 Tax=Streptomyces sp. NPDC097610 TaxID=3157227 RepID=UPI00332B4275